MTDVFHLGGRAVARIGYGALQLGTTPMREDDALQVLRLAVELGVNHIDTAEYYGPGLANERIRAALRPYPDDLAVVSKVGYRRLADGGLVSDPAPAHVRVAIEQNLRTLGRESLAAVNLRMPDPTGTPDEAFEDQLAELVRAREAGLIEGIGLSNVSAAQLERALELTDIVCVQNHFSLLDRSALAVLLDCERRGIAFVPYCPLGWPGASRTATLSNDVVLAQSHRLGVTGAQLILRWLLDISPNVLLIPGTSSSGHLRDNLAVRSVELDDVATTALSTLVSPASTTSAMQQGSKR